MRHNNFYAIPFILGLIGLFVQIRRRGHDALIVGLLFLFTGIAIVVYLNQPPLEPRERDYTFCGATFAFAIWIGLGVIGLGQALASALKAENARATVAILLGLISPTILLAQGWDDHNRSGRFNSVDSARNLLNSCAPNAILFTNGDNDTFPLWYIQEVEGVRTDVRVAVLSYLNTDWYIQQMKRRAYLSQPVPISMNDATYAQGNNDMLPFSPNPSVDSLDLKQFISLVGQGSPLLKYTEGNYSTMTFPTPSFPERGYGGGESPGYHPQRPPAPAREPPGMEHGQARHREEKPGDSGHDCHQQLEAAHLLQLHSGPGGLHEFAALFSARRHGLPPAAAARPTL